MLALLLSQRTAAWVGLAPDEVWDAGLSAVIAAFVLSRLLLVVENVHSFLQAPLLLLMVPSLTATGMAATLVVMLIWLRRKHLPVWKVLDAWAPCATLTWAFLALGHFAEGSDAGLPARFGIRMPGESTPLHPVALYVAFYALLLTDGLLYWLRRRRPAVGGVTAAALFAAGVGQFLIGFLRQPDMFGSTSMLDPLQWVSVGMMLAGAVVYVLTTPAEEASLV